MSRALAPILSFVPTAGVLLAAVLSLAGASCSPPSDSSSYEYASPDASAGSALGTTCDDTHACASGLSCRLAAECQRDEDAAAPSTDDEGRRMGESCSADAPCVIGYSCQPLVEHGTCVSDCALDSDCPGDGVCSAGRGPSEGWCVRPDGDIGTACQVENDCTPGLFCENRATGGYCTKTCGPGVPCPDPEHTVCTRMSGGFGSYCLERCEDGMASCRDHVACRKMTRADVWVCFPEF